MVKKPPLRLKKNPFPSVAHAGSWGRELIPVTVETANFSDLLRAFAGDTLAREPQAIVLTGPAGTGKTHFLKFVQYLYSRDDHAESKPGSTNLPPSRNDVLTFDCVVYLDGPGRDFCEFASMLFIRIFTNDFTRDVLDRLAAYPVIALCRTKAEAGDNRAENLRLAEELSKQPSRLQAYWGRFSPSEVFDSLERIVSQLSSHVGFRAAVVSMLRTMRDKEPIRPSFLAEALQGLLPARDATDSSVANPAQQKQSVQIVESVLGLFNLLGIRLLLLVDEAQQLLTTVEKENTNKLLRDLVNATPRQSVFIFALRTDHWEQFRDEATERRVRYFKLSMTEAEAREVIYKYVQVKGEVSEWGDKELQEFFPASAVHRAWETAERIIGKILSFCFQVVEYVIRSDWELPVERAVQQLSESRRIVSSDPGDSVAVRDLLAQLLEKTSFHVVRPMNVERQEFDFGVFRDRGSSGPTLLVRVLFARDDIEEADNALALASVLLRIRRQFPAVRLLTVFLGYSSPEVVHILKQVSDSALKFESDQPLFRQQISLFMETEMRASDEKRRDSTDDLRRVDVLTGILRSRAHDQKRLLLPRMLPFTRPAVAKRTFWFASLTFIGFLLAIEPFLLISGRSKEPVFVSIKNLTSQTDLDSLGKDLGIKLTLEFERLPQVISQLERGSLGPHQEGELALLRVPSDVAFVGEEDTEGFWRRWNRAVLRIPRRTIQVHLLSLPKGRVQASLAFSGFSKAYQGTTFELPFQTKDYAAPQAVEDLAVAIAWRLGDSSCKSPEGLVILVDISQGNLDLANFGAIYNSCGGDWAERARAFHSPDARLK